MLILSRVCVEFRDSRGTPVFRVTPGDRLSLLEAPEAIREDPIFSLLVAERSLEVVTSEKQAKQLEDLLNRTLSDANAISANVESTSAAMEEISASIQNLGSSLDIVVDGYNDINGITDQLIAQQV